MSVTVGREELAGLYITFQARTLAMPLSFMRMRSFCPSVGVHVGTQKVASVASAVTKYSSVVSIFGVGVALDVTDVSLCVEAPAKATNSHFPEARSVANTQDVCAVRQIYEEPPVYTISSTWYDVAVSHTLSHCAPFAHVAPVDHAGHVGPVAPCGPVAPVGHVGQVGPVAQVTHCIPCIPCAQSVVVKSKVVESVKVIR